MSCICNPLYGYGTLLRVRAESFESGRLEATVQQAFTSADAGPSDLMDGDRVGGSIGAEQPCNPNAPSALQSGVELLVLYSAGSNGDYPNCSDFHACANADCSGLEEPALTDCWSSCETQTEQVCADHRSAALLDGYFAWAVPWQEPLDFGASHQLSTSEIDVLTSVDACFEHFPEPPPPPCDDTRTITQCSAAPPGPGAPAFGTWPLLVGALALTWALRRTASSVHLDRSK